MVRGKRAVPPLMNDVAPRPDPTATSHHRVVAHGHHQPKNTKELAWLSLGALGVVYGDIGTSPLYAMRECFSPNNPHAATVNVENVLGILSLFVWSLILVVIIKYLVFVLRADNKGEGGTLALAALVAQKSDAPQNAARDPDPARAVRHRPAVRRRHHHAGDLGDVRGRGPQGAERAASPSSSSRSPPRSSSALFWVQKLRHRPHRLGVRLDRCSLWFFAIAAVGVPYIVRVPRGARRRCRRTTRAMFLATHGMQGFLLLGSVVLCITGCEALYADMGHFGRSADPHRVVVRRVPRPAPQLLRPGRAVSRTRARTVSSPFYDLVQRRRRCSSRW